MYSAECPNQTGVAIELPLGSFGLAGYLRSALFEGPEVDVPADDVLKAEVDCLEVRASLVLRLVDCVPQRFKTGEKIASLGVVVVEGLKRGALSADCALQLQRAGGGNIQLWSTCLLAWRWHGRRYGRVVRRKGGLLLAKLILEPFDASGRQSCSRATISRLRVRTSARSSSMRRLDSVVRSSISASSDGNRPRCSAERLLKMTCRTSRWSRETSPVSLQRRSK